MKKNNVKLMSALLTISLSGSGVTLSSCGYTEPKNESLTAVSTLGSTTKLDEISEAVNESNIKYLISELKKYGILCEYNKEISDIEVQSIDGYDYNNLPDRIYSLLNDLISLTAIDHLCCYSPNISSSLDLSKLDLSNIKHLGLFVNDEILNYINSTTLNFDSLCMLADSTSLSDNILNLNVKNIRKVTVLSGKSNLLELGNINFSGTDKSELVLSGVTITDKTIFNCNNVILTLNGVSKDPSAINNLSNTVFVYSDINTGSRVKYNPSKSNIDEIINRINQINGIRNLKKENM